MNVTPLPGAPRRAIRHDFVEVSPPYDPSGITSLLAAGTSLDFIGSIFHERAKRRASHRSRHRPVRPTVMIRSTT
jgi:hypothetical protein